jgi:hypothetical protein
VVRVTNGISFSEGKVPRNILTLEVSPRLGVIDLGPHVHASIVHGLVSRNPVVVTGTETLALVVHLFTTKIVQVVWKQVVGLVSQAGNISRVVVRDFSGK